MWKFKKVYGSRFPRVNTSKICAKKLPFLSASNNYAKSEHDIVFSRFLAFNPDFAVAIYRGFEILAATVRFGKVFCASLRCLLQNLG